MKNISVFGSTGSIGTQTLDIVRAFPGSFQVVGLSAGRNTELLLRQMEEFRPKVVCVQQPQDVAALKARFPAVEYLSGPEGLVQMAKLQVDVCVMAIVGFAALAPTLEAARSAKSLALANKESIVVAGSLLLPEVEASGCKLLPVDSEHNGLFQLLEGVKREQVDTIVLTASGGPLLRRPELALEAVTPEIAIRHPNWNMGPKISVDSATLMNKGLELVEASFLFDYPGSRIEVWIHPQSIVHAAVWLVDGTCLTQLGKPDMRAAIGHTLAYPERLPKVIQKLGLDQMAKLEFLPPDETRFPCLRLARQALESGPGSLIALNAANEIAVCAFLEKRISFPKIPQIVEEVLGQSWPAKVENLGQTVEIDVAARRAASSFFG